MRKRLAGVGSTYPRIAFVRTVLIAATFIPTNSNADPVEPLPPGAASCTGCHLSELVGETGALRSLATLSPEQISEALAAYRSGKREGTIMPRIAAGFSEVETRAIATALGRPAKAAP